MSHDSAAALLDDAGIVAAIEEGKLARTRTIGGIRAPPSSFVWNAPESVGVTWRTSQWPASLPAQFRDQQGKHPAGAGGNRTMWPLSGTWLAAGRIASKRSIIICVTLPAHSIRQVSNKP